MADALISVLLEQLASVVYQHTNQAVKLVLNAEKDVESFSSKLKAIQAVLEDAEKKQVTDPRVEDWLEKLKDVSYEMDDVLDEWNTEILRRQVEEKQEKEGENANVTKKKAEVSCGTETDWVQDSIRSYQSLTTAACRILFYYLRKISCCSCCATYTQRS